MTPPGSEQGQAEDVLDHVQRVAAEWSRALVRNEPTDIERFMTEDWVYVDSTGFRTRAEVIGWIRAGRLAHHSMDLVGEAVARRLGDTVVVTGRKRSSGVWDGSPYTADEWITEVFVHTELGWRCGFSQKTDVK